MDKLYEVQREKIIKQYSKNGTLTLLGKWQLAKLHMHYYPDVPVQPSDYQRDS